MKIQTGLNSWDKSQGPNIGPLRLDFVAKMVSSHDGTRPRDLLRGLVPSCVPTLNRFL